jgi:anti-sigma-K factor RskA
MTERNDTTEINDEHDEMDPRFENLAAYVLDALDHEDERTAVENLIENDQEVQAEYAELSEAAGLLAIAVPQVAPPASLKAAIMEQAANDRSTSQLQILADRYAVARSVKPWQTRIFGTGLAVSAAAAVLVLVVAGVLGFQNNQLGNEVAALRSELNVESTAVASLRTDLSTTMNDSETRVASMKTEMALMEDEFTTTTDMVVH